MPTSATYGQEFIRTLHEPGRASARIVRLHVRGAQGRFTWYGCRMRRRLGVSAYQRRPHSAASRPCSLVPDEVEPAAQGQEDDATSPILSEGQIPLDTKNIAKVKMREHPVGLLCRDRSLSVNYCIPGENASFHIQRVRVGTQPHSSMSRISVP
jgi:hypothetical protein